MEIDPDWTWEEFLEHYPEQTFFQDEDDYEQAKFRAIANQRTTKLGPQITD